MPKKKRGGASPNVVGSIVCPTDGLEQGGRGGVRARALTSLACVQGRRESPWRRR